MLHTIHSLFDYKTLHHCLCVPYTMTQQIHEQIAQLSILPSKRIHQNGNINIGIRTSDYTSFSSSSIAVEPVITTLLTFDDDDIEVEDSLLILELLLSLKESILITTRQISNRVI